MVACHRDGEIEILGDPRFGPSGNRAPADEPTGNLDTATAAEILALFAELHLETLDIAAARTPAKTADR